MIHRFIPRNIFSATGTATLGTDTGPGFSEGSVRPLGLTAALIVKNLTGTAPSITGKIQHSPSPDSVTDANAVWIDLLTFTAQTANGAQAQSTTSRYFPRLRATVTRGGTAVTNLDYDVIIA